MGSSPLLLLWTADPRVVRSVESLAGETGLEARRMDDGEPAEAPAVVVVDLDAPGALDWAEYLGALEEINYRGFLTVWPDPALPPGPQFTAISERLSRY